MKKFFITFAIFFSDCIFTNSKRKRTLETDKTLAKLSIEKGIKAALMNI
jgi:hypothetical protein